MGLDPDAQTFVIQYNRGGWNPNPNEDLVDPANMVEVENINLHTNGRETRGGTKKVNENAITGAPTITGFIEFRTFAGDSYIMTATSDGKVYSNYTTEIASGLTEDVKVNFVVFKNQVYLFNGKDVPMIWNGTGMMAALETAKRPTDWSTTNGYPTNAVVHGRGASERLWAYGVSLLPNNIYASKVNEDDFSDSEVQLLTIETGDGIGIVGLWEFLGELYAFGKQKPYRILDQSVDTADWGHVAADWKSGVSHDRLIAETNNDLITMSDTGEVFSIIRAQQTGDFEAVSLTRPAFIDFWIKENINLKKISDFFMVYDESLRAIKIFCIRKRQDFPDVALVYFIDRGPENGWSLHRWYHKNYLSVAGRVQIDETETRIYIGGRDGFVRELESEEILDDGEYFYNGFTEPFMTFGNPRLDKFYYSSWIAAKFQGSNKMISRIEIDGSPLVGDAIQIVDKDGNKLGFFVNEDGEQVTDPDDDDTFMALGTFENLSESIFNFETISPLGSYGRIYNASTDVGITGIRIRSEIVNEGVGHRAFWAQKMYDYKILGLPPAEGTS